MHKKKINITGLKAKKDVYKNNFKCVTHYVSLFINHTDDTVSSLN